MAKRDLFADFRRVLEEVAGPELAPRLEMRVREVLAGERLYVLHPDVEKKSAAVHEDMRQGKSTRQIAADLGLSERTVRRYMNRPWRARAW